MSGSNGKNYAYYPGCSLHSTAMEYNNSVESIFDVLGAGLQELEDWNCCSATSGHSLNRPLSLALPGRNLMLAQQTGSDVVMPCAACFNRHKTSEHALRKEPEKRAFIEDAVGFEYTGESTVRAVLDVVANDIGLDAIGAKVKQPLKGLKVVSYYGCLLVRPAEITQFENPEAPVLMDLLLAVLGAEVKKWSNMTDCCGGGLALTKPAIAANMVNRLGERAREAGADAIVTSCPLCQMNLEMRQSKEKTPIFYFTELMGLAFGLEDTRSWWGKHLIDPTGVLRSVDLV
jgi:heterodisulfide reductase subunit B